MLEEVNEDEIEREGNIYIAVDVHDDDFDCQCHGCVFIACSFYECDSIKCCGYQRKDGRNVIFVEKQK